MNSSRTICAYSSKPSELLLFLFNIIMIGLGKVGFLLFFIHTWHPSDLGDLELADFHMYLLFLINVTQLNIFTTIKI